MELIDCKNKSERQAALTKVEETEKELDSQLAEQRERRVHWGSELMQDESFFKHWMLIEVALLQILVDENSGVESASSGDEE